MTDHVFARVLSLYERGQCLDAWEVGRSQGALEDWPAVEPRLLACRLAHHLGAPRLSNRLVLALFRVHRAHPGAQYYRVSRVLERRGALAAWSERNRLGLPSAGDATALADYHGQCAQILGMLRDFDAAESHLAQSRVAADRPYWYAERAGVCELEDRYDEALRFAREGLAMSPQYPPTILATARALQLLDRTDEALDLLRSAAARTQSSHVLTFLIGVLLKRRLLDEADRALGRYDELTPLKEDTASNFIAVTRAEIAVHRGDYRAAIEHLEHVEHPFYARVAKNLRSFLADASGAQARRVELDVPFVRQYHMTCAPATLSAISQFWKRPAAHMEVAEEICYDGTPNHSERRWANENGWRTAEFRVDWDSAAGLIDRGAPFTLTLSDVASSHLVAVIGYDRPRDLLLARDPSRPDTVEINARELFEVQRASGPRGMAMVPLDQAHLLDDLHLPETELYDLFHELELALGRHDRDGALAVHHRMIAADARHRLTLHARRALAAYDDNPHEALAATDELLQLYPDDQALHLSRLGSLRGLSTRDDRLAWLARVCAGPSVDPALWTEYAVELLSDDRMLPRALHFVRRALRGRPDDAYGIEQLAVVTWAMGQRVDALELYRFAACLGHTREFMVQAYFDACRMLNLTDTGLAFLRARIERLGAQSGQPAITLYRALETLDRMDEAFAVLEAAVSRRPHDVELRIYTASRYAAWGQAQAAAAHLGAARGAKRTLLLAEEARAARLVGDRGRALEAWREILDSRPLDLEAHRAVALLLSETSDADAAAQHVQTYCDRFPHHAGLQHLLYAWTAARPAAERERVLRTLQAIDPANAWTTRELALNLCSQARFAEALQLADESIALDGSAPSHDVRAYVLQVAGRRAEAAESYRAAIGRSADASDAIRGLLDTAGDTRAQALEVLTFVEGKLLEQPVVGDGVLAFSAAARGILTPDELFLPLERLHAQRPDLWQSWSALCSHNAETGRTEEALRIARGATERFSHVPRVWLDLSRVHRARQEPEQEIAALRRCREINPEWTEAVVELVLALARAGRSDDSQHTLESAIRLMPLVPELRGHLAVLAHRRGETDKATEILRETLRVSPDYWWAWEKLTDWSQAQGRPTVALDLAAAFAESRPGESHPWVRLADIRMRVGRLDEALTAVERAIGISPQDAGAHDLKAWALAELRRFHDAKAACAPAAFGEAPPLLLRGRAAWVDARRGDLSEGIARMEELVEAHPDYAWGWNQLVDWYARRDAIPPAIRAAERLAWLEPHSPRPLAWIGDLKLRQGDRKGAAEAFQRAMRLQPSDVYAGFQVFQLQRGDKDFDGARRTLDILRPFALRADILAAEAELAAAQHDRDSYLANMRELCAAPDTGAQAPTRALEAAVRSDWRRHVERALKEVMLGPAWNPVTPVLWVRIRAQRGRLGGPGTYRWLAGLGESGKAAIREVLVQIGTVAKRGAANDPWTTPQLKVQLFLIQRYCTAWRGDDPYWGDFGYALSCFRQPRWAVRWMRDWRERSNVEPWMMQNLISSLLVLHRGAEARATLRAVGQDMAPRVDVGVILGLWGAIGACLDNDPPLAERLLHHTPRDLVSDAHRPLRDLAATLLDICRDPPSRASLTTERALRLERTTAELQGQPDSGYLARLAVLKAARHARAPWKVVQAWMALHSRRVWIGSLLALYVLVRLL
jgi:tetratricopeptide (TPR) repeat protein